MFLDAHTLKETALEADICIAGGGAAGMTLALDLRASGLSVILLESGGFRREAETQRLSDGRMIGINTWNMRSMRVRALGGATGHWEGWCRPLMPHDFETRDYIPNSGWPIQYADLLPWYARACETLEIGPFLWDAESRAKAVGAAVLPTGSAIDHRYYQFSPPTRFARTYGGALEKAENVRVIAHANVADIRLDENRGRVESLTCRTLVKTEFQVRANRYVLALGGIENPRVLLAARSQQPEGVANAYDVVGRYFMEHPHYYGSVGIVHLPNLDRRFYARMPSDLKRANGTPVPVMGAFGLTADIARSERLLNFSAAFHPVKVDGQTSVLPSETMQALLTRGGGAFQTAQLAIRAEQSPRAESRVSLGSEIDQLGMPRATLDWRIAPEDDVQMHRALVLLARELGASGIARAWIPGDSSTVPLAPIARRPPPRNHPDGHRPGDERRRWRLPNASGGESLHRRFFGVSDGRRGQPDLDDRRPRSQTGRYAEEDGMKAHPRREFLLRVLAACGTPLVFPAPAGAGAEQTSQAEPRRDARAQAAASYFGAAARCGANDWRSLLAPDQGRTDASLDPRAHRRRAADTGGRAKPEGGAYRARQRGAPRFSGRERHPAGGMDRVEDGSGALCPDAAAGRLGNQCSGKCTACAYNILLAYAPTASRGVPHLNLRHALGLAAIATIAVLTATCTTPTKPAPVVELAIHSVTPAAGPATGGTEVTIRGAAFAAGATITIGGRAATEVSVRSSDMVTAKTPASPIAGPVDIMVSSGGRSSVLTGGFSYEQLAPNTSPVIRSIAAQGKRVRQPLGVC